MKISDLTEDEIILCYLCRHAFIDSYLSGCLLKKDFNINKSECEYFKSKKKIFIGE